MDNQKKKKSLHKGQQCGLQTPITRVQMPAPPRSSCGSLGKLLNLSMLPFPPQSIGQNNDFTGPSVTEIK